MKKIVLSAIIIFTTMISFAQAPIERDESVASLNTEKSLLAVTYRLFPTENMWTFIKLNTRNGQMWQVQYDVRDNDRFEAYLNILPLIDKEEEVDNRFTLYPTQNIWTFILLDQLDGRVWQVQWSIEPKERAIFRIK